MNAVPYPEKKPQCANERKWGMGTVGSTSACRQCSFLIPLSLLSPFISVCFRLPPLRVHLRSRSGRTASARPLGAATAAGGNRMDPRVVLARADPSLNRVPAGWSQVGMAIGTPPNSAERLARMPGSEYSIAREYQSARSACQQSRTKARAVSGRRCHDRCWYHPRAPPDEYPRAPARRALAAEAPAKPS